MRTRLTVLLCALALATGSCKKQPKPAPPADDKPSSEALAKRPATETANWPSHRGDAALRGIASGSLARTLSPLWRKKIGDQLESSPVIADGRLFIGSDDEHLYALEVETGKTLWTFKTGNIVEAAPMVKGETVYVGSTDGLLYAVDAATGKEKWRYKSGGEIKAAPSWALRGQTPVILIGSYDSKLHCVEAASGKRLWTYKADNYINGTPALTDGKVVFGGCDSDIHVVSLAGKKLARIDAGSYIAASAAIAGGRVYIGNRKGQFICADLNSQQVVWRYQRRKRKNRPIHSSAAVSETRIVFGSRDGNVICIDIYGKPVWKFKTGDQVDSSPVICGDKVVVGSDDGRLYLLSLIDGTKLWSRELGQAIAGSPAVTAGRVFVACADGFVYAFASDR